MIPRPSGGILAGFRGSSGKGGLSAFGTNALLATPSRPKVASVPTTSPNIVVPNKGSNSWGKGDGSVGKGAGKPSMSGASRPPTPTIASNHASQKQCNNSWGQQQGSNSWGQEQAGNSWGKHQSSNSSNSWGQQQASNSWEKQKGSSGKGSGKSSVTPSSALRANAQKPSGAGKKGEASGKGAGRGVKASGKDNGGTSQAPQPKMDPLRIRLRNFPPSWCLAGTEILADFLRATLESFGTLSQPVKVSPNRTEAEAIFSEASEAEQAISSLNGEDLRAEEEKDDPEYKGLMVKPGSATQGWEDDVSSTKKTEPAVEPAVEDSHESNDSKKKAAPSQVNPPAIPVTVPQLEGTWNRAFRNDKGEHQDGKFIISENGQVKKGRKILQLVQGGSIDDVRQDPNYTFDGCFLLNCIMGEDSWEYIWHEDNAIQIHHFASSESGKSPLGSPNFWGEGTGTLIQTSANDEEGSSEAAPQLNPPAIPVSVPEFANTWYRTFWDDKGEHGDGKYTISENGQVQKGKRTLQLVQAGSVDDVRQDSNYEFDGCFLLNDVSGKNSWEYMWLEDGSIQMHHFAEDEKGKSPKGSPNFWAAGKGTTKPNQTKWATTKDKSSSGGVIERAKERGETLRDMFGGPPPSWGNRGQDSRGDDSWGKKKSWGDDRRKEQGSWGDDAWSKNKEKDSWGNDSWSDSRKRQHEPWADDSWGQKKQRY